MKFTETKVGRDSFKLEEFDSIHEFMGTIEKRPVNTKTYPGMSVSSKRVTKDENSWEGTKTYKEAHELLGSGWTTVAQKLAKRIPTTTKSQNTQKSKPFFSVVGGSVSVPRYVMGIPTSMVDKRKTPIKSKIIVINKDMSYSAIVSSTQIFEEGVKALQIIQSLEGKGYRVKLNMCWAVTDSNETVGLRVTIKKPEDRMSLQKVAFPIAHTSMLRRIGFRWLETCPFTVNSFSSYGRPATDTLKNKLDKKEIFLPRQIPDVDKFIEQLGY